MKEANEEMKWIDREPYAFWRGNPHMGGNRFDLLKCNVTDEHDWNARIYAQVCFELAHSQLVLLTRCESNGLKLLPIFHFTYFCLTDPCLNK